MRVSAKTGEGLEQLRSIMTEFVRRNAVSDAIFLHERHIECIERAVNLIDNAASSLEGSLPCDLAAMDLSGALSALGEITGRTTDLDVINRIFTDFCVGK